MADSLDADSPAKIQVPDATARMVAEKTARRQCLQCGRIVGSDEAYRRGLCAADRIATQRAVEAGETSYDKLIARGLFTPAAVVGRKKRHTALDDFLEGKEPSPAPAPTGPKSPEQAKQVEGVKAAVAGKGRGAKKGG